MLLPGLHVIARFVATTTGANVLRGSWARLQQREADEIAVALLERSGLPVFSLALGLEYGMRRTQLPDDDWGERYRESMWRVFLMAAVTPVPRTTALRD